VNLPPCTYQNQCGNNNGGCHPLSTCTDTGKGRICSACQAGYAGDGYGDCPDINECATNNGGCDPVTACRNTVGSRTCDPCPEDYAGDGETGCFPTQTRVDININFDHLHRTVTIQCPFVDQIIKVVTLATYGCQDGSVSSSDYLSSVADAQGQNEFTFDAPSVNAITCSDGSQGRFQISYICANDQPSQSTTYTKIGDSIFPENESVKASVDESTPVWIIGGLSVFAVLALVAVKCITRKHSDYESIPQ